MSSGIWKIGQETSAQNFYNDIKNGIIGCLFLRGDTFAVNQLTSICNAMTRAYDEVIDDKNEYLFEMDKEIKEFENYKEDVDAKIKQLINEIKSLEQKKQDGSITEEEEKDLENKKEELSTLMSDYGTKIDDKTKGVKEKNDDTINKHKSKAAIAKDYGETTIEKGTPLAETKVSHGFFKKLFGCTGKGKKEAGEKAVKAGNELLDKVNISNEIDSDINKKYNFFNVK